MKQIRNKEYEEWQKYKAEKAKVRDAEKSGQHVLEVLPKITEQGDGLKL